MQRYTESILSLKAKDKQHKESRNEDMYVMFCRARLLPISIGQTGQSISYIEHRIPGSLFFLAPGPLLNYLSHAETQMKRIRLESAGGGNLWMMNSTNRQW